MKNQPDTFSLIIGYILFGTVALGTLLTITAQVAIHYGWYKP